MQATYCLEYSRQYIQYAAREFTCICTIANEVHLLPENPMWRVYFPQMWVFSTFYNTAGGMDERRGSQKQLLAELEQLQTRDLMVNNKLCT